MEYRGVIFKQKYFSNKNHASNYINYIATRDGVVLNTNSGFGLWGNICKPIWHTSDIQDLQRASNEASQAIDNGRTVHSAVISLGSLVAQNKGYYSRHSWESLIEDKIRVIAKGMDIRMSSFRWCAAYHNEFGHPHAHIVFWDESSRIHGRQKKSAFQSYTEEVRMSINERIFGKELKELKNSLEIEKKLLEEHSEAVLYNSLNYTDNTSSQISTTILGKVYCPTKYGTGQTGRLVKLIDTAAALLHKTENKPSSLKYKDLSHPLKHALDGCIDEIFSISTNLSKIYTNYLDSTIEYAGLLAGKNEAMYERLFENKKNEIYSAMAESILTFIEKNNLHKLGEDELCTYVINALNALGEFKFSPEDIIYTRYFNDLKVSQKAARSFNYKSKENNLLNDALVKSVPTMEVRNLLLALHKTNFLPSSITDLFKELSDTQLKGIARNTAKAAFSNVTNDMSNSEEIYTYASECIENHILKHSKKIVFTESDQKYLASTAAKNISVRLAVAMGIDIYQKLREKYGDSCAENVARLISENAEEYAGLDKVLLENGIATAKEQLVEWLCTQKEKAPKSIVKIFEEKCTIVQILELTSADKSRLNDELRLLARHYEDGLLANGCDIYDKSMLSQFGQQLIENLKNEAIKAYKKEDFKDINLYDITYFELCKLAEEKYTQLTDIGIDISSTVNLTIHMDSVENSGRNGFFMAIDYMKMALVYAELGVNSYTEKELQSSMKKMSFALRQRVAELVKTSNNSEIRKVFLELCEKTPARYQSYSTFMDDDYMSKLNSISKTLLEDKEINRLDTSLRAMHCFSEQDLDLYDRYKSLTNSSYRELFNAVMGSVFIENGWDAQFKAQLMQGLLSSVANMLYSMSYTQYSQNTDKSLQLKRKSTLMMTKSQKRELFKRLKGLGKDYNNGYEL